MSPAELIRRAREDAVTIEMRDGELYIATQYDNARERWFDELYARQEEVIKALGFEGRLDWWKQPVEGWADGYIEIFNIVRDEYTRIEFREASKARKDRAA